MGIDPSPIALPKTASPLTNEDVLLGPRIDPVARLATFSDAEWVQFVREWATGLKQYKKVRQVGGAGDEGRDVIGCVGESSLSDPWDNFQCKHYDHKLAPTQVYGEVGSVRWLDACSNKDGAVFCCQGARIRKHISEREKARRCSVDL